jgi:hypothetical protein
MIMTKRIEGATEQGDMAVESSGLVESPAPSEAAFLRIVLVRSDHLLSPSLDESGSPQPGPPDDVLITALYLEAERTRLPHEPPYHVERGLQRFSTWLDNEAEPQA